jgi:membrane protease YdiL (CAAX protease family)
LQRTFQAEAVFHSEEDMMNSGRGVAILLMNVVGIILVTILLAPLAMPVIEFLVPLIPGLPKLLGTQSYPGGYNFAPVWRIVNELVIMAFLLVSTWRMGFRSLGSLGLPFNVGWMGLLWRGFLWGLIGYMIIIGAALLVGARQVQVGLGGWPLLGKLFHMLIIGTVAGIWKEIVFRGMIFQVIQRCIGTIASALVTSVVFGIYLIPVDVKVPARLGVIDWGVGVRGLQEHLRILVSPGESILALFMVFFLMGLVLNYTLIWTGNLFFPIGLHSVWNFCDKSDRFFLNRELRWWLFGQEGIGPALFGWTALILFLCYVGVRYRYRSQRLDDARVSP